MYNNHNYNIDNEKIREYNNTYNNNDFNTRKEYI